MEVFFNTSLNFKKKKGYYKNIDFSPFITALDHYVEVKDNVHWLGTSILTKKQMIDMFMIYMQQINVEDLELISNSQKTKISNALFKILRKEE